MSLTQTGLSIADTTLSVVTLLLGVAALGLWIDALALGDGTTAWANALMCSFLMLVALVLDMGVERAMG